MFKLNKFVLITAALASGSAIAGVNNNDMYFGVGVGQSFLAPDYANGDKGPRDRDLALQAFLGYDIGDWIGAELNYADLGDLEVGSKSLGYSVTSLQGLLHYPNNSNEYSLYGKLGASYLDLDNSDNIPVSTKHDWSVSGGIGLRWMMSENWHARAEYNIYNSDIQAAFLQFAYAWGGNEPVAAPVVTPEPEVEVAPEPIFVTIDDSKNVAAIFDFDSATINDSSRLDQIATMLEDSKGQIVVRAHTDSMGAEAYNQKLSEERAQSAVDYFVSKGIDSSRFVAQGMGELYPAVSNDTKEGRAQNRRLEVGYSIEQQQ